MKTVRVFASSQTIGILSSSILSRKDLSVFMQERMEGCAQILLKHQTDLAVFEDDGTETLAWVMADLATRFLRAPFQVFVLNAMTEGGRFPQMVSRVFPSGWSLADFNQAVAVAMNLPTRKCVRIPVRLSLQFVDADPGFIASTVNVSASGLLIQSLKPLAAGKVYGVRFVGQGRASSAQISAKVLREDEGRPTGLSTRHYILEWVGVTGSAMEAFLDGFVPADPS